MKISGNGDLLGRIPLNLPGQPAPSMPRGFGEILQKTLNEAAPAEPAGASAGASVLILFQPAVPLPRAADGDGRHPDTPAVAAAVFEAIGVWFDEFPLTPERVLRGLGKVRNRW